MLTCWHPFSLTVKEVFSDSTSHSLINSSDFSVTPSHFPNSHAPPPVFISSHESEIGNLTICLIFFFFVWQPPVPSHIAIKLRGLTYREIPGPVYQLLCSLGWSSFLTGDVWKWEHVVTDHPSCASTTYVMCCVQYHQVYSTLGYSTGLDLSLMMSFLILPSESDQNSGYTTINNSAYSPSASVKLNWLWEV